jgi:peptidylprolyl isomerase
MRKPPLYIALAVSAGLLVSGCGSSTAPGVELAPSAGATQAVVPTTPKPPPALAAKPVVTPPSSCSGKQVVKQDLVPGTGQVAQVGRTVVVNYVGVLCKTGTEFDSSWKRNQPFTTPLSPGSVITGWVQGVAGMRVGGRRELIIPPSLGYGSKASGPIPANSTLVFVVDLLSVS